MFAKVYETFGNRYLENYGFCPSHYLSATTLRWDAMLSMTKAEWDPFSNVYMYLFCFLKKKWETEFLKFVKMQQKEQQTFKMFWSWKFDKY